MPKTNLEFREANAHGSVTHVYHTREVPAAMTILTLVIAALLLGVAIWILVEVRTAQRLTRECHRDVLYVKGKLNGGRAVGPEIPEEGDTDGD